MNSAGQPAVFLDRDGTLMEEVDYCRDPKDVRVIEGASEALRALQARGFVLILVTNQSGIGRGKFTLAEYERVHAEFLRQLGEGFIAETFFCPEAPWEATERRKPAPGMLLEAAQKHGLDLARSWMIGDKPSDVECGHRAGARSILVQTGYGSSAEGGEAEFVAKDIVTAAEFILKTTDAQL